MYKVLSTKKLDTSLINKTKQSDIEIIEQEFISIKPIRTEEKYKEIIELVVSGNEYVAFTSSNAVTIVDDFMGYRNTFYIIDWKIFCISGKTKEAVLNAHLLEKNIVGEAEYGADLAKKIIEAGVKNIIHFCGNKRRDELSAILSKEGISVREVVVYETVETPTIKASDLDAILFFSPSAVQSFFSINKLEKKTVCFAIGTTTADSIADFTDNKIIISEYPSQEMILTSMNIYFQNKS